MRWLSALPLATLIACSPRSVESHDSLRYGADQVIPYGRLHADARLDSFAVTMASGTLAQMKEPRLDPASRHGDAFRLLYEPAFQGPIAIRVMTGTSGCRVVRKEAVQLPLPEVGREGDVILLGPPRDSLVRADSVEIGRTECDELAAAVDSLQLETEPNAVVGPDGEMFLFERLQGGRYLAREVWSPDSSRAARYRRAGTLLLRWAPPRR